MDILRNGMYEFTFKRLSVEEYGIIGNSPVWRLEDIACVLASFELEISGAYGDDKTLYNFKRTNKINNDGTIFELKGLDVKYSISRIKWIDYLTTSMFQKKILFANIFNDKYGVFESVNKEYKNGITFDYETCVLNASDLLEFLSTEASINNIQFDINRFKDFLSGNSSAPHKSLIEYKEIPPKDYNRNLVVERHSKVKPLKIGLLDFLRKDLSGDCTCTKRQACDRIFNAKYRGEEVYLKRETGYGILSFERKVSKILQEIEDSKPIEARLNRHENTDGFSYTKLPTCPVHGKK